MYVNQTISIWKNPLSIFVRSLLLFYYFKNTLDNKYVCKSYWWTICNIIWYVYQFYPKTTVLLVEELCTKMVANNCCYHKLVHELHTSSIMFSHTLQAEELQMIMFSLHLAIILLLMTFANIDLATILLLATCANLFWQKQNVHLSCPTQYY